MDCPSSSSLSGSLVIFSISSAQSCRASCLQWCVQLLSLALPTLTHLAPSQIILAIYYTIADIVLLLQCFYYRGFTWKDEVIPPAPKPSTRTEPNERTGLIDSQNGNHHPFHDRERRGSDWSNLSPAVPLLDGPPSSPVSPPTVLQTVIWNSLAILMVCAAGVVGWFLSRRYSHSDDTHEGHKKHGQDTDELTFNLWGQVFGWLCAVLYLGSRLPQILLNYRRKSTEGVSMLFFLFACLGNLTYVLSIFAYDPHCGRHGCDTMHGYGRYILVNLSWLAGSMGTLLLDMCIFVQFFIYRKDEESEYDDDEDSGDRQSIDEDRWDQRPLLARNDSGQ